MVLRDNSLSNKYLEKFIFMSFLIRGTWCRSQSLD